MQPSGGMVTVDITGVTGRCDLSIAGVIYQLQVSCSDCPATYIAQTGRTIQLRLHEHKYALTSRNVNNCAIAENAPDTGHVIIWDEAKVIDSHPHWKQRCVQESWHIQQKAHTINRERGQQPHAYRQLTRT